MRRSITIPILTAVATAVLATACSKEPPAPVYQLVPVSRRDIVVSASAAGTIEPISTVDVKSKASGEIMAVSVDIGDVVKKGQQLVKVDPRMPQNALRQAEANLEVAKAQVTNAESQWKRSQELHKTQAITDQEYESARLSLASANAQLVSAQRNLEDARIAFDDTDIRAPIDGTIITRPLQPGTVISSATSNVSGGTTLMQMANLDTVQVRALVDETDIGKIQPGMTVTITVDAYPNRPFRGSVLKIEPQATVNQNVTMFPVIMRIANEESLLRPGMNANVEVHVGERTNVLAIPNAALRTERDVGSAAMVLGLSDQTVNQELAQARQAQAEQGSGEASMGGRPAAAVDSSGRETITMMGREITLPEGVTREQAQAVFEKMRSGGGFQSLSAEDRALLQKLRPNGGAGGRGGFRQQGGGSTGIEALFGGDYIVFVKDNGTPKPVPVRTGLTDLDYSEVLSGLEATDTVLVLPSASLVAAQQEFQDRIARRGGLPGVQRQDNNSSSNNSRSNSRPSGPPPGR